MVDFGTEYVLDANRTLIRPAWTSLTALSNASFKGFTPLGVFVFSRHIWSYLLCSPKNFGGAYSRRLVRPSVSPSVRPIRVRPFSKLFPAHSFVIWSWFKNYFTWMITILRWRVVCKFRLLPWRSRSQQDLTAKSCPAYNFIIWSRILHFFYINVHHIETCRVIHFGRFLKVKVTAWPFSIIVSGPQLSFLKSYLKTISHEWSPCWDDVLRTTFGSLPWRSRSQYDLSAK